MGSGVTKGGWFITDVWHLNIIYYLCGSTHLNEVSLHLKSVMIKRGCSSAVLACTCLESESLLLPATVSSVVCYPLSDEIGQCGEVSLLHHFVLASENGCATERAACSTFCSKRQVFINMNNLSIRFYHRNLSSPARNRSTTWK